jgi:hypothetical protein
MMSQILSLAKIEVQMTKAQRDERRRKGRKKEEEKKVSFDYDLEQAGGVEG